MILDPTKDIPSSRDRALLAGFLSLLVGQPCVKAEFSYGGEFKFHFGGPVSYGHPKLAGQTKGAWVLGVRASKWRLLFSNPPLLVEVGWSNERRADADPGAPHATTEEETLEKAAGQLVGQMVTEVQPLPSPPGLGLQIVFSDGANLVICPNLEADEEPEPLADWGATTPYCSRLQCGPGSVWSYLHFQAADGSQRRRMAFSD